MKRRRRNLDRADLGTCTSKTETAGGQDQGLAFNRERRFETGRRVKIHFEYSASIMKGMVSVGPETARNEKKVQRSHTCIFRKRKS